MRFAWSVALFVTALHSLHADATMVAEKYALLAESATERSYEASFSIPTGPVANALLTFAIAGKASWGATGLFELQVEDAAGFAFASTRVVKPQRATSVTFDVTALLNRAAARKKQTITLRVSNFSSADGEVPPLSLDLTKNPEIRTAATEAGLSTEGLIQPTETEGEIVAESVFPTAPRGSDVSCKLLYPPTRISTVFSPLTGEVFREGSDYALTEEGLIIFASGGIKITPSEELYSKHPKLRSFPLNDGRDQLAPEGRWWNERQIGVTYTTRPAKNSEPIHANHDAIFADLKTRTETEGPLRLVIVGDSISAGSNASSLDNLSPYGTTWASQFAERLRHQLKISVALTNFALPGMDSVWGREHARFFFSHTKPDLLILAFGMNDRSRVSPTDFLENIRTIIKEARQANPRCAIILVSSMRNNPLWGDQKNLDLFRDGLKSLVGPGVRLADMTGTTDHLLTRKTYYDLTGNGVNHPNDYLIRWYTETVGKAFDQ